MAVSVWFDVRHAMRQLRRRPAFTAMAVVTLALGIGVNSSIFALYNALNLRPLSVENPYELVEISVVLRTGQRVPMSFPMFRELTRRQTTLKSTIGWFGNLILNIEAEGRVDSATVMGVTGNFFSELGARPALGRLMLPSDVNVGTFNSSPVAVLGFAFWTRRYGADPTVVGRTVKVRGSPFTIIGVAPRGFKGLGLFAEPEITIPVTGYTLVSGGTESDYRDATNVLWMKMAGRLRPSVTLLESQAEFSAIWPGIKADVIPPSHSGLQRQNFLDLSLVVESIANGEERFLRQRFTLPLCFLLGISLIVLLMTCLNLASFMLPRIAGRAHELAVRRMFGASRWQLGRGVFVEVAIVAAVGGCCAVLFGYWTSSVVATAILSSGLGHANIDTSPDLRVLGFTAAAALLAAFVAALVPAWLATQGAIHDQLRSGSQSARGSGRLGRAFIIGQLALSAMLLTNAVLFSKSLVKLLIVEPGFQVDGIHVARFEVASRIRSRPASESYYPALLERVGAITGVNSVSISYRSLASNPFVQLVSSMDGEPMEGVPAAFNSVSPGFFDTLAIPIIKGRDFTWRDRNDSPRVAILNRLLARALFPSRDAMGQRIRIGTQPYRQDVEIVGIVPDAKLYGLKGVTPYSVFIPALQHGEPTVGGLLIVRGSGFVEDQLQLAVRSVGPDYISRIETLKQSFKNATNHERVIASLAAVLAGLALLVAGLGVGGLVAYTVSLRTRDIAVHFAVGATRPRIVRSIVWQVGSTAAMAIAIGIAGGIWSAGYARALLFEVSPADPVALVVVAALSLLVSVCACVLPILRIASMDTARALRVE